ncbi:hypothetical protein NQ315_008947 [Exocentrus adspersus]|uniref:Uncharacterized protein n=1 Tax=Exocentrus adspersus TaxID=1586481 RepID=A0AAV8V8M3_9CUCU|nr:hypothetical protein NQ315_008947 [Exocentrus adspersus]
MKIGKSVQASSGPAVTVADPAGSRSSPVQCESTESRFKTIKRRKNSLQSQNKCSGSSPSSVPFEDEFDKIKSIEDSLEPEVLIDATHKTMNIKRSLASSNLLADSSDVKKTQDTPKKRRVNDGPKRKSDKVVDTLLTIHKEKESNRERRHKEKLELSQMLIKSRQASSNNDDSN